MISGAVNQAGAKEDRLETKFLTQTLNGFDEVFKTAERPNPNKYPQKKPAPGLSADPRLRADFKQARAERRPPPRAEIRGVEHQERLAKTGAPARPIQKAAKAEPPPPTEEADRPGLPAKTLERREGTGTETDSQVAPPSMMAQVGLAAYRLAPHGLGEAQFAEAAGAVPVGESLVEPETLGAEAAKQEKTALFSKPELKPDIPIEVNLQKPTALRVGDSDLLTPVDILNLSRETSEVSLKMQEPSLLDVKPDSAQARNELMMRLQQGTAPQLSTAIAAAQAAPLLNRPLDIGRAGSDILKNSETGNPIQSVLPTTGGAMATGALGDDSSAVRVEQILDRIAQQARWIIRANRTEASFRLQPEELGEVHLKVTQTEGLVRVDLTVENLTVKQLLESRMDELQKLLQDRELASQNFEFNVDVRQGERFSQNQNFARAGFNRGGETDGQEAESAQPAGANGAATPVWGRSGSGIYV